MTGIYKKVIVVILVGCLGGVYYANILSCANNPSELKLGPDDYAIMYDLNIGNGKGQIDKNIVRWKNIKYKLNGIPAQAYNKNHYEFNFFTNDNIVHEYYEFNGWYLDKDFTIPLNKKFNFYNWTKKIVTCYAQWTYSLAYLQVVHRSSFLSFDAKLLNSDEIKQGTQKHFLTNSNFTLDEIDGRQYKDTYNTGVNPGANFECWIYVKKITLTLQISYEYLIPNIDKTYTDLNFSSPQISILKAQKLMFTGLGKLYDKNYDTNKFELNINIIDNSYFLPIMWANSLN